MKKQQEFADCLKALSNKISKQVPSSPTLFAQDPVSRLINHLKDYETKIRERKKEEEENEAAFQTHFNAVVALLQKLNHMVHVKPEDVVLTFPEDEAYDSDAAIRRYLIYAALGTVVGSLIGVIGGCITIAMIGLHAGLGAFLVYTIFGAMLGGAIGGLSPLSWNRIIEEWFTPGLKAADLDLLDTKVLINAYTVLQPEVELADMRSALI